MLWAALFAIAAHASVLWLAASLRVSLPRDSVSLVSVSLLQRAVPLPVAENLGTVQQASSLPPPSFPVRKPPQSKPLPQQKRLVTKPAPPPMNPALVKEAPPPVLGENPTLQLALSSDETLSERNESSDQNSSEGAGASTGGNTKQETNGVGRVSGIPGNGNGASQVVQPDYGVNPKPLYPILARRIGAQGVVLLRVHVREDGSVATVELAHSSGFLLLDESATQTVRDRWRFIPARLDGVPIESWVEVPINFVLADS